MTALEKFVRLECSGLWRAGPQEGDRPVGVSFGKTSLVITDAGGRALAHWSLAAVGRANPGMMPAVFVPSAEGDEALEIDDPTMIEAIETVMSAVRRPVSGRGGALRRLLGAGVLALVLGAGALWLPDLLREQTVRLLPAPARAAIGTALLAEIAARTGPLCRNPRAEAALALLRTRLEAAVPGAGGRRLVVARAPLAGPVSLPGGVIVLPDSLIRAHDTPDALVAALLAEAARRALADPLAVMLDGAGPRSTLHLLTTGALPPETLRAGAGVLLARPPAPADPGRVLPARLLGDGDWVALQQICG